MKQFMEKKKLKLLFWNAIVLDLCLVSIQPSLHGRLPPSMQ